MILSHYISNPENWIILAIISIIVYGLYWSENLEDEDIG